MGIFHEYNGIGQFIEIKTLEVEGVHRDYLRIAYSGNETLYVPLEQFRLVRKYSGREGAVPKLSHLSGGDWQKKKAHIKERVNELADRLIALYGQRAKQTGFAFPPDDELQKKFEDEFPYQLTADQARSLNEIKADMEKPEIMYYIRTVSVSTNISTTTVTGEAFDNKNHTSTTYKVILPAEEWTTAASHTYTIAIKDADGNLLSKNASWNQVFRARVSDWANYKWVKEQAKTNEKFINTSFVNTDPYTASWWETWGPTVIELVLILLLGFFFFRMETSDDLRGSRSADSRDSHCLSDGCSSFVCGCFQ